MSGAEVIPVPGGENPRMTEQHPRECGTCRYVGPYARLSENGASGGEWHSCRRYAPRGPILDFDNVRGIDFFPPVRGHDWCGEYDHPPRPSEERE
jgi:hypothetical protein